MPMRFYQNWQLYPQLPMAGERKLPDEGFEPRVVNIGMADYGPVNMEVWCKPKPKEGEQWGHRVMVKCACGRDIPFGRMGQHWPTCSKVRT